MYLQALPRRLPSTPALRSERIHASENKEIRITCLEYREAIVRV